MEVFWQKGYEGASLPDLTEAMGINRPSLYAAFGNKEALFRKALDSYTEWTRIVCSTGDGGTHWHAQLLRSCCLARRTC